MGTTTPLQARIEELARREGLLSAETTKARIYRDRVGGTIVWLPHDSDRMELTLIQIRMVDENRASRLHGLLADCVGLSVAEIPSHELGVEAERALESWTRLETEFFGPYLRAHREVQARQSPFRGPPDPRRQDARR